MIVYVDPFDGQMLLRLPTHSCFACFYNVPNSQQSPLTLLLLEPWTFCCQQLCWTFSYCQYCRWAFLLLLMSFPDLIISIPMMISLNFRKVESVINLSVEHHSTINSPFVMRLVMMKYLIVICLVRVLLEALSFFSRRIELLLS